MLCYKQGLRSLTPELNSIRPDHRVRKGPYLRYENFSERYQSNNSEKLHVRLFETKLHAAKFSVAVKTHDWNGHVHARKDLRDSLGIYLTTMWSVIDGTPQSEKCYLLYMSVLQLHELQNAGAAHKTGADMSVW